MPKVEKIQPVHARVSCDRDGAVEVFVAGTFNGWNPRATPLKQGSRSQWSTELELIPGFYEYKFVIDGEWCCAPGCDSKNPACEKCVPNAFGTMNRRLEVS